MNSKTLYTILTILCLGALFCNTCSAQYVVARKGYVVKFDTAVVTNAPTFRLESKKINLLEQLQKGQDKEIKSLKLETAKQDSLLLVQRRLFVVKQQESAAKDTAMQELNTQLTAAQKLIKKQGRWYNKNSVWAVVGAGIMLLIVR